MENHKQIVAALAAKQGELVAGCKCKGTNVNQDFEAMRDEVDIVLVGKDDTCEDCAEVRALDLCWHEWILIALNVNFTKKTEWSCEHCYKHVWENMQPTNPDLTTEPYKIDGKPQGKLWITHIMQVLGEWDKFIISLEGKPITSIVIDGKDLVPAIEAYLKEREGKQ